MMFRPGMTPFFSEIPDYTVWYWEADGFTLKVDLLWNKCGIVVAHSYVHDIPTNWEFAHE